MDKNSLENPRKKLEIGGELSKEERLDILNNLNKYEIEGPKGDETYTHSFRIMGGSGTVVDKFEKGEYIIAAMNDFRAFHRDANSENQFIIAIDTKGNVLLSDVDEVSNFEGRNRMDVFGKSHKLSEKYSKILTVEELPTKELSVKILNENGKENTLTVKLRGKIKEI